MTSGRYLEKIYKIRHSMGDIKSCFMECIGTAIRNRVCGQDPNLTCSNSLQDVLLRINVEIKCL